MRPVLATFLLVALFVPAVSARDEWYDYYDSALGALRSGDYATAIEMIEAALARKGRSGYLRTYGNNYIRYAPYFQLGVAQHGAGDCEGALASFDGSETRRETADVPELDLRLHELREECEVRLAPPVVDPAPAAVEKRPPIDRRRLERGLAVYLEGDFQAAIALLEALRADHPDSARLRLLLGMALHGAWVAGGETDDAMIEGARAAVARAASLDPTLVPDPALCPPRVAALFRSLR